MTTLAADPITDVLLPRLERLGPVKSVGGRKWEAKCPAHEDDRASLSVTRGGNGCALLHCFAGCQTKDICAKLGIKLSDLFVRDGSRGNGRAPSRRIVKTYDYVDGEGQLLYQAIRYEPKDFRQRRPDGNGGWLHSLNGTPRVLYRLPELNEADPEEWVLIVEGEKDADRLASLGFVATTNAMGAGKWLAEYSETLRARRVAILPDNDKPGDDHAETVAKSLTGIAAEVRVVRLPDLPRKGDVSDFLDAGGTAARLRDLVDAAPAWRPMNHAEVALDMGGDPPQTRPRAPGHTTDRPRCTDLGNAQRFVTRHGPDVRYCHAWGSWLVWDGRRWRRDDTGAVVRLAKDTARNIWTELKHADDQDRDELFKWAKRSESAERITAMLKLAQSEPGVPVVTEDLDADRWLLNVESGTIDLRTGTHREHRRADLLTKLAPVSYDAAATAPVWLAFLNKIMAQNVELIRFLCRLAGYSLTGETREQCLAILHGTGSNGKTTFLETLRAMFGDYADKAAFASFLAKSHDGPRNDLAKLRGARLVIASEIEDGRRLSESVVKELTGQETITARFLYQEEFEFVPTFKLWFGVNHKPVIRGTDEGIWRRVRLIPFDVTIPDHERDTTLQARLRSELPGILNWCLDGCAEWQLEGLGVPDAVRAATAEYRKEMDTFGDFIADCCVTGDQCAAGATPLYQAYKTWAVLNGENPISQTKFGTRLRERGFKSGRDTSGDRVEWSGIGIRAADDASDSSSYVPFPDSPDSPDSYPGKSSHEGRR